MQLSLNLGLFLTDLRQLTDRIRTLKRMLGTPWRAPSDSATLEQSA